MSEKPEPKKRGRKKKSDVEAKKEETSAPASESVIEPVSGSEQVSACAPVQEQEGPKKRGRKPKGGKIIPVVKATTNVIEKSKNIILHLKCCLKDLDQNNNANNISAYDNNNHNDFELLENTTLYPMDNQNMKESIKENFQELTVNKEEVLNKINTLRLNLSKNNISDKRSACFWCTYDFHNPPIFIPKREKSDGYEVYGCFCTPECGVAYLMDEMIDSSIKFERYQLMNYIYGKSLNYSSNIKPAPNPHYLLDKYYGNLTIEEYRSTLHNNNYLIFVEKPLTHVFPEMFNDNLDFTLMKDNGTNNSLSQFKIKKASESNNKPKTKSEIVKEKFGVA